MKKVLKIWNNILGVFMRSNFLFFFVFADHPLWNEQSKNISFKTREKNEVAWLAKSLISYGFVPDFARSILEITNFKNNLLLGLGWNKTCIQVVIKGGETSILGNFCVDRSKNKEDKKWREKLPAKTTFDLLKGPVQNPFWMCEKQH